LQVQVPTAGLQVRRVWHLPSFWSHAMTSMVQARNAPGNIGADGRIIDGVHHTLSVWTDMDAMRAYLTAGPHLEAMRPFPGIATGKVFGHQTDRSPDWSAINAIRRDHARNV
jgi:hypothetical protein